MSTPTTDDETRLDRLLAALSLPELVGQLHQPPDLDPDDPEHADLLRSGLVGSTILAGGPLAGMHGDGGLRRDTIARVRALAAEAPHGTGILVARDVIHGHRSVWPIPLGLAATWDPELAQDCAALAAREAAADDVDWVYAPMLDLVDDPRWGRVAESLGESPALAERLGAALVRGLQADGRVAACAKHYVGYGLARGGRDYAAASVGEITLRNHHLRPFRAAVDAGCRTVMASFTAVDGIPLHAHRRLLREVLKDEWGFEGVVVSDWDGVGELVAHGVAADRRDAARQAIEAGVDVDMSSGLYAAHLVGLVEAGDVDRALVEDAARRVLRLKLRLGLLEPERPAPPPPQPLDRVLVRRAAQRSLTVLADDGVLPLDPRATTVHLTGPFVHEGAALLGTWVLDGDGDDVVSPAAALGARFAALGAADRLRVTDGRFPDLAVVASRETDATVAVVGEHPRRSGEDASVTDLGLPAGQLELLRLLAGAGAPLVVVVITGRPLVLDEVRRLASAVVVAWHPGIEAGPALAGLLLGDEPPRGRLPMTFPPSVGHVPLTSAEHPTGRPLPVGGRRSRYLDADDVPTLPLGAGLGGGDVRYAVATASATELSRDGGSVEIAVEVENPGPRAGTELVRLELRDVVAEVSRPRAELLDWVWLDLEPGARATARFAVSADDLGYTGRDLRRRVDAGAVELTVGRGRADATTLAVTVR